MPRAPRSDGSHRLSRSRKVEANTAPSTAGSDAEANETSPSPTIEAESARAVLTAVWRAKLANLRPDERASVLETVAEIEHFVAHGGRPGARSQYEWATVPLDLSAEIHPADALVSDSVADQAEKHAIRALLLSLSQATPSVLASALGVASSTLYAYADPKRQNRPGPEELLRAAYLCDRLGRELQLLGESMRGVARHSRPVKRGRPVTRRED